MPKSIIAGMIIVTGIFRTTFKFKCNFLTDSGIKIKKSTFKPELIEQLGQGGFAKVFKARFNDDLVAMKYIPLDKVKDGYQYDISSYGVHEYYNQDTASQRFTNVDKPLTYFFAEKVSY